MTSSTNSYQTNKTCYYHQDFCQQHLLHQYAVLPLLLIFYFAQSRLSDNLTELASAVFDALPLKSEEPHGYIKPCMRVYHIQALF